MSFALVSAGATTVGAGGATSSPSFGVPPTALDLLILSVAGFAGTASLANPATPAGWTQAAQVMAQDATSCTSSLYYKIAAGGDAAPSIAGIAGNAFITKLYEFSGNDVISPLDRAATVAPSAVTTPQVITNAAPDATAGELVIVVGACRYSLANVKTLANTMNNGAVSTDDDNDAANTGNHYCLGFGITTGNASPTSNSLAFTAANLARLTQALATFRLYSPTSLQQLAPLAHRFA